MQLKSAMIGVYPLCPEDAGLFADGIPLQRPQVAHRVKVQFLDEFRDMLPLHAVTLGMEVEAFVPDVRCSRLTFRRLL
jgi:hypothetical protein